MLVIMGVVTLTLFALSPARAADGGLDPSFNPGAGVGRAPILWGQSTYTDGSNKSLISGAFTMVGSTLRNHIARLNGDGSLDTSFNCALEGTEVRGTWLLNPALGNNASKILICGPFSIASTNGTYNGLARLNSDGSVDTSFAHTFGPGEGLSGIAVQPADGKILISGGSMVVNGYPGVYCLLRLNPDGSVDTSYPMRPDSGGFIHGVYAFNNSGPYANGARFTGTIPRFDGSGHMDYMLILANDGNTVLARLGDEVVDGPIINVIDQPGDSKVLIAGMFTQVYGASRNGIARLSADMLSRDDTFNPGTGANHLVRRINLQTDGKILLAGFFTSFNNDTSRKYLVRLTSTGTVDGSFNPGNGPDDCVWSMWQRADTTWMVLGTFRLFNDSVRHGIANLTTDGSLNPVYSAVTIYNTAIGKVNATALQTDGKILIGGGFSSCGGKYHPGIARLNPDGTTDASFQGRGGGARRIAVQPDGKILIAGGISFVTGYVARTGVARLNPDGTSDQTFNPKVLRPDGSWGDLSTVRVLDNGQIMIAGDFGTVNGVSRSIAARLNSNGTLDNTFTVGLTLPGTNIVGRRVVPTAGDKYLLLGNYLLTGGSTQGFLTRLFNNGGNDNTWGPDPAHQNNVISMNAANSAMLLQTDEKVLVCGDFTQIFAGSTSDRSHIARITAAGQLDNTFIPLTTDNSIRTMALQPSGKVLIGGAFTAPFNRVARLNSSGSLDPTFVPGDGLDGPVNNFVHIPAQGKAIIAGEFTTFNGYHGFSRPGIARLFASDGSSNPAVFMLLLE
jgi:uncharacterized delta-60 repeat protein